MNGNDQRVIKAVLGTIGVMAAAFGKTPEVSIPLAMSSAVLAGSSIAFETMDIVENQQGKAHIVIRPLSEIENEEWV